MGFGNLVAKNQFGEQSNLSILGGSSQIVCQFTVAPADSGGNGVTGLSGQGISAVYMHTSATPSANNPNPAAGLILVQFQNSFAGLLSFTGSQIVPLSGSSVNVSTGLTQHAVYVITALGTTTAAEWATLGVPANVVPAVGVSFLAATATAGTGTGTVQTMLATGSTLNHIEMVGGVVNAPTGNGYSILACLAPTSSSVTTLAVAAPAVGTVVNLDFNLIQNPGSPI